MYLPTTLLFQEWYTTQGHNSVTSSPARGLPGSNALDKKRDDRSREVQAWDPESAVLHVREVDVHGGLGRDSFGWTGSQPVQFPECAQSLAPGHSKHRCLQSHLMFVTTITTNTVPKVLCHVCSSPGHCPINQLPSWTQSQYGMKPYT